MPEKKNNARGEGGDLVSVVHSTEDSPREDSERDLSEFPRAGRNREAEENEEKNEGMTLDREVSRRRPVITDQPADISPLTVVGEENVGAVIRSDEDTMRDYELAAALEEEGGPNDGEQAS